MKLQVVLDMLKTAETMAVVHKVETCVDVEGVMQYRTGSSRIEGGDRYVTDGFG